MTKKQLSQKTQQSRQLTASQLRRKTASFVEILDRMFFVFAGVATLWLGVLLFIEGFSVNLMYWSYFIIFWMVVAYLGLPRLHRILAHMYVPDYFIGRAKTSDGLLGDPINIGIRGNEAQLHSAMRAAGWVLADEITARSSWKMLTSIIRKKSYKHAPVSALFLFGRRQDFSYQKEVDGSPRQRHHIRFWHCPKDWILPGGHRVDWLADATYDTAAGFSWFTLQLTHRIDENTDIERDFVVESVREHNDQATVTLIKDFSTGYHSRNGGGDRIVTDGDLPVLELEDLPASGDIPARYGTIFDATLPEGANGIVSPTELGDALWRRRPLQLLAAALLAAGAVIIEIFSLGQELVALNTQTILEGQHLLMVSFVAVGVAAIIIESVLVYLVLQGSNLARMWLLALATFYIVNVSAGFFMYSEPISFGNSLVSMSLHIGLLLALSSDSARKFTNRHKQKAL